MLDWFYAESPVALVAATVILVLFGAGGLGIYFRRRRGVEREQDETGAEQLIVSAILGLLALLLGFTFALAIDRFDTRRGLVVAEANAIGTAWLRAQLLDEPHRSRLSRLLEGYAANRLELARAQDRGEGLPLLQRNDAYQNRIWQATVEAVRPIRNLEISSTLVEAMNNVIDTGAERKAARRAHVPPRVLTILLVYMGVTAYAVGYALLGGRVRWAAIVLLLLLSLSYLLILDIDQPTRGGIREQQSAMEDLIASMRSGPPPAAVR